MQLLFAIPDKRLCSGIGQNKVHDRDLKEAHQERLTHIPRRKGHPVGLEPTTPCPASRANNPTDSATLRQLGRPSGCCLSIYEVIGQIQKEKSKKREARFACLSCFEFIKQNRTLNRILKLRNDNGFSVFHG